MRDTLTALAANIRGRTGLAEQTSVDGDDDEHRESGDVVLDDGRSERDSLPQGRQIGVLSTTFLIVNRIIGAGVFVTPSAILQSSGSIGLSLIMWALGALIATAGLLVYLEWGTALPQNGGEKRYLEFAYRKPRFLAICMFATYAVLLGWCAGNSIVVGEYLLAAAGKQSDRWNSRAIGLGVITFALLVHGLALKWGLRIMNLLGVFKSALLLFIVFTGFAALAGHTRLEEPPHNFRNAFEGTTADAYGITTSLYNVIWSFIGFSNANYAMQEIKNPVRTLRIAGPLAIGVISVLYMLANIAYFAAVPKEDILNSGQTIAAVFFRNMFGPKAEKALSVFVALSALGNVMAVLFSQGRINQALAREGVIPFSRFFASNRPFNAPFAGLALHWTVSVIIMLAPPEGDAYNFCLNLVSYPLNVINTLVSGALVFLYFAPASLKESWGWNPPVRASMPVAAFFCLASAFLVVAPYIPPDQGQSVYKSLPYYLHCVVGLGILFLGALYWLIWTRILPSIFRYKLVREATRLADGTTIHVFRRVPVRIGSNSSSSSEGDSEFAKGHGTTAIAEYAGGYADAERTSKDRSEDGDEEEEEEDGKNGSETPNSGSGSGKGLGWVRGLNEA